MGWSDDHGKLQTEQELCRLWKRPIWSREDQARSNTKERFSSVSALQDLAQHARSLQINPSTWPMVRCQRHSSVRSVAEGFSRLPRLGALFGLAKRAHNRPYRHEQRLRSNQLPMDHQKLQQQAYRPDRCTFPFPGPLPDRGPLGRRIGSSVSQQLLLILATALREWALRRRPCWIRITGRRGRPAAGH